MEVLNGRFGVECFNIHQIRSLDDTRAIIEARRIEYNQHRPHSSLGHLTSNEFLKQRQENQTAEVAIYFG